MLYGKEDREEAKIFGTYLWFRKCRCRLPKYKLNKESIDLGLPIN